jgi:hypothetical protein
VVELQNALAERIQSLEQAMAHIKTLQGIIPLCMYCHKIRNDQESWERIESYLTEHTDAKFSHGICPECLKIHFPDQAEEINRAIDPSCKSLKQK